MITEPLSTVDGSPNLSTTDICMMVWVIRLVFDIEGFLKQIFDQSYGTPKVLNHPQDFAHVITNSTKYYSSFQQTDFQNNKVRLNQLEEDKNPIDLSYPLFPYV